MANATVNANCTALCFSNDTSYSLLQFGRSGDEPLHIYRGIAPSGPLRLGLSQRGSPGALAQVALTINGTDAFSGPKTLVAGAAGGSIVIHATPGSTLHVSELTVRPAGRLPSPRWIELNAADGISGAGCGECYGNNPPYKTPEWTSWAKAGSSGGVPAAALFRGRSAGYVGTNLSNRSVVKWSFRGTAARLYLPKAPGMAEAPSRIRTNSHPKTDRCTKRRL